VAKEDEQDKKPGVVGYWVSIEGTKHVALFESTTCGIAFPADNPPPPAKKEEPTCKACMEWYEAKESD